MKISKESIIDYFYDNNNNLILEDIYKSDLNIRYDFYDYMSRSIPEYINRWSIPRNVLSVFKYDQDKTYFDVEPNWKSVSAYKNDVTVIEYIQGVDEYCRAFVSSFPIASCKEYPMRSWSDENKNKTIKDIKSEIDREFIEVENDVLFDLIYKCNPEKVNFKSNYDYEKHKIVYSYKNFDEELDKEVTIHGWSKGSCRLIWNKLHNDIDCHIYLIEDGANGVFIDSNFYVMDAPNPQYMKSGTLYTEFIGMSILNTAGVKEIIL